MSFALLFSGQGTQHADMLRWVADDELVQLTNAQLGVADWRVALQDADWASRNANVQIVLTGIGLAAWQQIATFLPKPAAVAGYSVGELAAFSAAGVFDATTAIGLARARAEAMNRAAATAPGGLLAVTGLSMARIELFCAEWGAWLAIRNDSHAVVLGGPHAALNAIEPVAAAEGAKCVRLNVEVASHTPCMQSAVAEFAAVLSSVSLQAPDLALFANAADRIFAREDAARALAAQIAQTVRWDDCLENVQSRRISCVLEIGPGNALARMWSQRYPNVPVRSADEFHTRASIVDWVRGHSQFDDDTRRECGTVPGRGR